MHSYVKGTADQNCPPWPDRIVTTCMSYLTTGGPGKECRTNKLPASGGIQERSKGERRHRSMCPTDLPESSLGSILAARTTRRTLSQNDWPETTRDWPHYHKPRDYEPQGWAVLLGPLPSKGSCSVSMCVSSDNPFLRVRQQPTLGLWNGVPLPVGYHLSFFLVNEYMFLS